MNLRRHLIQREDRDRGAEILRRWLAGSITNFEFDDQWPYRSHDRAVAEIGRELWKYFDDFPEKQLSTDDLNAATKDLIVRCLDFLQTGLPYEYNVSRLPLSERIATFFRPAPLNLSPDERQFWPFSSSEERKNAAH